ncbi:peptidylprolyl isomerase [Paenibacillus sp. FSL R7-0273]|uniref:peptidylprolyl isomerase n=1 Tax=Paenibacillus sp. FSL R7-0273 TaxID=1536772 RepID=UPI000694634D|nr:peptidylprolyl isomerase [Paenibacillus sp. FSL R7-0273]OMF97405.1 peptidylprolyl isomerase [Paenibacillus sp. FSL R7-0273]
MDKKEFEGNEQLNNNATPEETAASANNNEASVEAEPVFTAADETVPAAQAAVEPDSNPAAPETVPVMSKVGGGSTPPSSPKGGKGWMIASIVLAAALIIVLIKPPFQKDESSTAVATVNGADITRAQLYDKLVEAGGETTLQNLITTTLVSQEAKKANITVTDEDINAEIEDLKTQFGGEDALNAALAQSSMTLDDLKAQMPLQVEIRKLLEPQITVTDEDISAYFDENKATFNQEEQVQASHILVETKEEADAIVKQLNEGADFAALAKEKSADTGSKENGGDLGFFKKGDMVPEFSDAAFALKVGETSGAVKSDYGYHIIKVTDRKEAKEYTLDEKKEEIRKTLTSQKVSELSSTWLQDLTTNAKITNTLTDEPGASATPAASADPEATEAPAAE